MSNLPILTAQDLIRVLKKIGFEIIRQKGSHVFVAHEDGRTTVVIKIEEFGIRDRIFAWGINPV